MVVSRALALCNQMNSQFGDDVGDGVSFNPSAHLTVQSCGKVDTCSSHVVVAK